MAPMERRAGDYRLLITDFRLKTLATRHVHPSSLARLTLIFAVFILSLTYRDKQGRLLALPGTLDSSSTVIRMKHLKKTLASLFSVAALFASSPGSMNGQQPNSVSASANVEATIVAVTDQIEITWIEDLQFGQIIPSMNPGTVNVSASNLRSPAGGVTLGMRIQFHAAAYKVTGGANMHFQISYDPSPPKPIEIKLNNLQTMNVDELKTDLPGDTQGVLDANGSKTFNLGGKLHVGSNQAKGIYQGSYEISAAYQ
jgi:hypothetical protein